MNLGMQPAKRPRPFEDRTAFLLNANARAVTPAVAARLREIVPEGDLFFSRSLSDAEAFLLTILRRGYRQVFVGGGDGTVVTAVNVMRRLAAEHRLPVPQLGLLRLGTGNALAYLLEAKAPLVDTWHVTRHGPMRSEQLELIECSDGTVTPFAGLGYDGEVLNDYVAVKEAVRGPLGHYLVQTVAGYLAAIFLRTAPRRLRGGSPHVRITTRADAVLMRANKQGDEEVRIPAGTVLWDGPAGFMSVGSIPYFGFGLRMFPFAGAKPGTFQLRVGDVPVRDILPRIFPGIWTGRFRHPRMLDFLVEDIEVEASEALPYQVGGDAAGHASALRFRTAKQPLEVVVLEKRLKPSRNPITRFLPAFTPRRA